MPRPSRGSRDGVLGRPGPCGRVWAVAGRWWKGARALGGLLGLVAASTGCVERVIHDYDVVADGEGGLVDTDTDTDTDTFGDSSEVSSSSGTTTPVDPGAECTIPEDCGDDQTCYQGVCVGTGNVRVSLAWNVVTDLDLHVRVPNGDWISYQLPITSYGQLDVDDCVAGACINQDGTHVENVFLDENAPRGTYGVMIANFDGRSGADYAIEVAGEASASFVGYLPDSMSVEGPVHEFTW